MAVKIGEMNWIVTALARGMDCKVVKYNIRARVPASPLKISIFLFSFFPNMWTFLILRTDKLITNVIKALKKTISTGGMLVRNLTPAFIIAKKKVAINIYRTPIVIFT